MTQVILAVALIALTAPDGRHKIYLNPGEISSLREPVHKDRHGPGTRCIVSMTSGRFNAVREPCETIHRLIGR